MITLNIKDLNSAAEWSGYSKYDIIQCMKMYNFECPYYASAYLNAASLAVMIYGDRHKWNMQRAEKMVENKPWKK